MSVSHKNALSHTISHFRGTDLPGQYARPFFD
jgi:hypothetical protein